jgi:hypothetical protein
VKEINTVATTNQHPHIKQDVPNLVQIQKFLGGLDSPADKQSLIRRAKQEGAHDVVTRTME